MASARTALAETSATGEFKRTERYVQGLWFGGGGGGKSVVIACGSFCFFNRRRVCGHLKKMFRVGGEALDAVGVGEKRVSTA